MNTDTELDNRAKARHGNFKRQEYVVKTHHHTPDAGIDYENLLRPEYWSNVAVNLTVGDYINVLAFDMTYAAQLVVIDVDSNNSVWAKVAEVYKSSLVNKQPSSNKKNYKWDELFSVSFSNPHTKWQIQRKSDNVILDSNHSTEEEAIKWAKNHLKTVGV